MVGKTNTTQFSVFFVSHQFEWSEYLGHIFTFSELMLQCLGIYNEYSSHCGAFKQLNNYEKNRSIIWSIITHVAAI